MSLINREALYEKVCGLEAQALSYAGKILNDETRTEEWRIWSAVLAERTAFKQDVFDAPEVQPEIIMCKDCKHLKRSETSSKLMMCQRRGRLLNLVGEFDFCSKAERRTE